MSTDLLASNGSTSAEVRAAYRRNRKTRSISAHRPDIAALDARDRRLYRAGIRCHLRKPRGADRPVASARARVPQTGGHRLAKLDVEKQQAFIAAYENLLNSLGPDEAALFGDAVHPTHAAGPVGCWAPKDDKLAIEQTSGRERLNIHGAIDLKTGQTRMIEAETINAASTIRLLEALEAAYPLLAMIHVFLDNAKYHHAKLVQEWLAQPGRRIKLHFIPAYCPHLNPIERLWGVRAIC
jgi:transposase